MFGHNQIGLLVLVISGVTCQMFTKRPWLFIAENRTSCALSGCTDTKFTAKEAWKKSLTMQAAHHGKLYAL